MQFLDISAKMCSTRRTLMENPDKCIQNYRNNYSDLPISNQ